MTEPVIRMQDVHKTYAMDGVQVHALRGIDLQVESGEFLAIMGSSGSGKSTLMNILGCLDLPDAGHYWLNGADVTHLGADELAGIRNRGVGFVFQNFNLLPRASALDNVAMPLSYTAGQLSDRQASRQARTVLERLGLGDRLHHHPSQLSGGQQQRVAIARALVNNPPLIFADEPTGNLDSRTSAEVLRLFQQLNEQDGITIIIVTHDMTVAQSARRTICIHDGQIVDNAVCAHPEIGLTEAAVHGGAP